MRSPGRSFGRVPRFFHRPVNMLSTALVGTLLLGIYIYGIQLPSPASSYRLKGARSLLGVFSKGSSMGGHGFNVHNSAIRKQTRPHVFATLFHSELTNKFKMDQPKSVEGDELVRVLKSMEAAGVNAVVYSLTWQFAQPDKDTIQWDYIDRIMGAACNSTSLKVEMIVDLFHAPPWVRAQHPSSVAVDSTGRPYEHELSMFHPQATELATTFLRLVSRHLAHVYQGCAVGVQPTFNNEYEAKFTQEYDAYQDYSPPALEAYRSWLRSQVESLDLLNARWGTTFAQWHEVEPPRLLSGSRLGIDVSSRFWDWMVFREEYGAGVLIGACATVQAAGLKCFHHFPEFFSVLDGIYGASMFRRLAASEHVDWVILDSNFMTPYGTMIKASKLRLYVSAAVPYGKPAYFEAAVERFSEARLLQEGFQNAMLAGADLGITNWLDRVPMDSKLKAAFDGAPSRCPVEELVGVFLHLESCAAWMGPQWRTSSNDPLHDFTEELSARLSEKCGTDIVVYIELDRFLADMARFDRAVFVEPIVLYGGRQLELYSEVRAALQAIPHEVLAMPTNMSTGTVLTVIEDLRPQGKAYAAAAA